MTGHQVLQLQAQYISNTQSIRNRFSEGKFPCNESNNLSLYYKDVCSL